MITLSTQQLAEIIQGKIIRRDADAEASSPLTDSRVDAVPYSKVFFALKGKNHDGHQFLAELIRKGLRMAVISDPGAAIGIGGCDIILVDDPLRALQRWAAFHRAGSDAEIVGVTGSNGKTIVKEWLYQLLRQEKSIVRSPKSYNSQVGVPLSVLLLQEDHELAIFEAGISHPGEMIHLEKIIQPQIGILTNIGNAHSENFPDRKSLIKNKLELFRSSESIIYCSNDRETDEYIKTHFPKAERLDWGTHPEAWLQQKETIREGTFTRIHVKSVVGEFKFRIPFSDQASVDNAMTCCSYLIKKGLEPQRIIAGMEQIAPIEMRLELLPGNENSVIINDSYNSDIVSLSIALDFVQQQKGSQQRTLILSDIQQDKRNDDELYAEVGRLLQQKGIKKVYAIGDRIVLLDKHFTGEKHFFPGTAEFLKSVGSADFRNEIVLIKGARSFGFERISQRLQQKAHETVMEIDLSALAHNFHHYRNQLLPETKIMAMVKAFSYGSGGAEIASMLEFNRCDYLAVAYADEGVELRKSGIRLPIMVMNPERSSFDTMLRHQLEPEIYSFRLLEELISILQHNGNPGIRIHLKIDTGMHRLGFLPNEVEQLCGILKQHPEIKIASVFSHLAGSESTELDSFTKEQARQFNLAAKQISEAIGYSPLKHLLNSTGISRFPELQFDMVRVGIGLYGIGTTPNDKAALLPVNRLRTIISQIKKVGAHQTVGYGRKGKVEKDAVIATLPIGYADGFSRALSNGRGEVIVHGKRAKVIGNVCMDMTMIDISTIPEAREGDEVIIFGAELPVAEIAEKLGTIPYEILTSVSARVKRVYLRE